MRNRLEKGMKIYTQSPKSGSKPKSIVVSLHGYGSNGQDLIGLAPEYAESLPDTLFVSPDAPFPCEAGFGFQWFSLRSFTPAELLRGAVEAVPILNEFLDALLAEHDLPASKLALVGFSQGTMMSLYAGPRRKEPLAGILGYSGALVGGEMMIGNPTISRCPVHIIHGDHDTVVPVAAYYHATTTLKMAGFDVSGSVTHGLPHSIDRKGIEDGKEFLKRVLTL